MTSFVPTQAENNLVNQILAVADTQKLNLVTGDAAVKVFAGAKLPPTVLGEIWALADKENNGFLTRSGIATAVRLIGHAQKGEPVNEAALDSPAPLAHIEGISPPKRAAHSPSVPSSPPPQSPPPRNLPPLTLEDKSKFLRLFIGCGPVDGLLSGEKARGVFLKSKLPVDKLGAIWSLADTQNRGVLDQTDFTIAMYLIQSVMAGQLPVIPSTLPPGLYEQAGGRPSRGSLAQTTGNGSTINPSLTGSFTSSVVNSQFGSPVASQATGQQPLQPQGTGQGFSASMMRQPHVGFSPQNTGSVIGASAFGHVASIPWDVTSAEKARFDQFFDSLDTSRVGYIEADVAVPFMLQSNLSQEVLAPVWDLADLNNDGRLNRDGFAIAMHLIQGKLAGKEIPNVMPESLLPPSMRKGKGLAIVPQPPPEPVRDLLWDDSPPVSPTAPQHVTASPPAGILNVQRTGPTSLPTRQPIASSTSTPVPASDPFTAAFSPGAAARDLLSDDEETVSPPRPLPDNSVEIGNLQNQLQSTNRSLEATKSERQNTEQSIATQASQLSALQTQLASAKAGYDTETRLLATLRERFASQAAEIQKAREDLIRAESDLSATRVGKSELEGNFMRDKEDHRELQRKMREVGEEAQRLTASMEKIKKDTKHQKGLLAIAKKQLASREAERAKAAKELEEAEREAHESTAELQMIEAELAKVPEPVQANGTARPASPFTRTDTPSIAAAMPLPSSPSPQASIASPGSAKSNNPFERLAMASGTSTPRSQPSFPLPVDNARSESPFALPQGASATSTDLPRPSSPFTNIKEVKSPNSASFEVVRTASPSIHLAETSTTATSSEAPEDPFSTTEADEKDSSESTTVATTPDPPATPQQTSLTSDAVTLPDTSAKVSSYSPSVDVQQTARPNNEKKGSVDPMVADAKEHFPAVDEAFPVSFSGGAMAISTDSPDMGAQALEIEHDDESDSDSEFHDAPAPLSPGDEADRKQEVFDTTTFASFSGESKPTAGTNGMSGASGGISTPNKHFDDAFGFNDAAKPAVNSVAPSDTFDDAFGIKSGHMSDEKPDPAASGSEDAFAVKDTPKPSATETSKFPASSDLLDNFFSEMQPKSSGDDGINGINATSQPGESGISAFDEAMGTLAPGSSTSQPQWGESFEDNFDFNAAAKADVSAFPAPSAPQTAFPLPPTTNGAPSKSTSAFDDAFLASTQSTGMQPTTLARAPSISQSSPKQPPSLSASQVSGKVPTMTDAFGSVSSRMSMAPSARSGVDHGISFGDVFGGSGPSLGDTLGPPPTSDNEARRKESETTTSNIITQSPPGSPTSQPSRTSVRSSSPVARPTSPRARPSTASSAESHTLAPPKPAQRHSKISIRLPFGRKDKKKSKNEPPPPALPNRSSTFLSPVEEPGRTVSPAVSDDVEPVKQLCAMGFSRTQAVNALENNGYNFQKALNSLLTTTTS